MDETNCDCCGQEMEIQDSTVCGICLRDGLCPDCAADTDIHECETENEDE